MKTRFRWFASAAAFTLASLTMSTSAALQSETLSKITNYKQWTQVNRDWPVGLMAVDGASIAG